MDPSNLPLYLGAAATAYGMANLPLTPLSAAAVGGVAGGVIKRVYDEIHASQESTQNPDDYYYTHPPSKRLRGYSQDNMDVDKNLIIQNMAYPRSSRLGVKRFKKKVAWKRRSWKKAGSKFPRKKGGFSDIAISQAAPTHMRKLATKTISMTAYQFDTTGTVTLVNGMAQGNTQVGDRIGRDIFMHELCLTGFVQNRTVATINVGRLMVFVDTMPAGATPGITDIMDAATSLSFPNKNWCKRFVILYDDTIPLIGQPGTTGTSSCRALSLRIPIKMSAYYNSSNAGTIADLEKNAVYVFFSGSTAAGTAAAEAYVAMQLTYIAQ